jgi:DNA (cytosine-5)-methyltransferase 1
MTLFNCFLVCGAGGTTRGAVMAKLQVTFGFDLDNTAGQTWKHNFPNSRFYEIRADEFIAFEFRDNCIFVDILHLSPPCQVFSPIKVREGKNDEMNFASLFAVRGVIEKVRPRMVTLEQTFGILHNKHKAAFHALIRMFTDHGYSVFWQIVDFHKWGLPQRRKRLIIVAAW